MTFRKIMLNLDSDNYKIFKHMIRKQIVCVNMSHGEKERYKKEDI